MADGFAPMHPEYLKTRFRVSEPVVEWPDRLERWPASEWPGEFVIVSAYATTGVNRPGIIGDCLT